MTPPRRCKLPDDWIPLAIELGARFVAYAEQRELDRLARVATFRQRLEMFMRKATSNGAKGKGTVREATDDTSGLGERVADDSLPLGLLEEEWSVSRGGHAEGVGGPSGHYPGPKRKMRKLDFWESLSRTRTEFPVAEVEPPKTDLDCWADPNFYPEWEEWKEQARLDAGRDIFAEFGFQWIDGTGSSKAPPTVTMAKILKLYEDLAEAVEQLKEEIDRQWNTDSKRIKDTCFEMQQVLEMFIDFLGEVSEECSALEESDIDRDNPDLWERTWSGMTQAKAVVDDCLDPLVSDVLEYAGAVLIKWMERFMRLMEWVKDLRLPTRMEELDR